MIPDPSTLISEMINISSASLPSDREDLVACVSSEQIRIGVWLMAVLHKSEGVHVSSLRNWAVSKLHGITRLTEEDVANDFRAVLCDGPGGTLESIGDVIPLRGGFYLPTPPTAVVGPLDTAIIVSGIPSAYLGDLRDRLHMGPVGRTLSNCPASLLTSHGFRLVGLGQYARADEVPESPLEYLRSIIDLTPHEAWQARQGMEPYAGSAVGHGGFAFGHSGRRVRVGLAMIELWRYTSPSGYREFSIRVEQGNMSEAVPLDTQAWRRIAFALDSIHNRPREVKCVHRGNRITLEVGFSLPPPEFRLLYAASAAWRPGGAHARYEMRAEELPIVRDAFGHCWIRLKEENV